MIMGRTGENKSIGMYDHLARGRKLPEKITYTIECMYCQYLTQLVIRSESGEYGLTDGEVLYALCEKDKEIAWCERCKRDSIHRFIKFQRWVQEN